MKQITLFLALLLNLTVFCQDKKLPEGWDKILLEGQTAYMNLVTGDVSYVLPKTVASVPKKVVEYDPTITHKVKKGETLSSISRKYNKHLSELYRLNSLVNFDSIEIGDEIVIGYRQEKIKEQYQNVIYDNETSNEEVVTDYHIVQSGDTLYSISKKYKVNLTTLKRKNNLSSNAIFVGQKLQIK